MTVERRACVYCDDTVTHPDPDVDYCRNCYWMGNHLQAAVDEVGSVLSEKYGWPEGYVQHAGGGLFYFAIDIADMARTIWCGWDTPDYSDFYCVYGPLHTGMRINGCIYRLALPGERIEGWRHQPTPGEMVTFAAAEDVDVGDDPVASLDAFLRGALAVPSDQYVTI